MAEFDQQLPIPEHIAVIMDGNGRWAKSRGKIRNEGHREGAKSVEAILESCADIGVKYLTLYAFSSENWKRPQDEVDGLMKLLTHFLQIKTAKLIRNNVRFRVIGDVDKLPDSSVKQLNKTIAATEDCSGLTVYVALSYGSREEIVHATQTLMRKAISGEVKPKDIDTDNFGDFLFTRGCPDPDLLIRTSGELRISNFLLWQISYSEIYITDVFWPDFRRKHLEVAIGDYQKRQRRYGGLG